MATLRIERVTALPALASRLAHTLYFVSVGADHTELYVTGNDAATMRRLFNEADVQALIDSAISGISAMEIVADIAARDALTLTANAMVLVEDATGDTSVDAGAALYAYKAADDAFSKVSEYESLDVILQWSNIQGGPASTPTAIDQAVANSHTHANKTQLDKVDQNADGDLTYDGREYVRSGAVAW